MPGSPALTALVAAAVLLTGCCAPTTARSSGSPVSGAARSTRVGATAAPVTSTVVASGEASGTAAADAVRATMTRRQQIAQLFVVGVRLDDLAPGRSLAAAGVGGLFLAGRSRAPVSALATTTAAWRGASPRVRPWVATDFEGGAVQALTGPGFPRLPRARAQGAMPGPQLTALARSAGSALAAAGVDLDLAPVADAVPAGTEAANAPIGAFGRQYGSTPPGAAAGAARVVDGLGDAGVRATLKHFPGLGRVRTDTDTTADVLDTTTTADDPQVAAFGELARDVHEPFVMVSSAVYTRIDPSQPAAFSPAVVDGVLRGRQGFSGVVVSDDLGTARAVAATAPGERAVRFLAAGGTLVLTVDPALLPAMEDAVAARSASDPAFAARVSAAVDVALRAKTAAGLTAPP